MTPNERPLTERPPDDRSPPCPPSAMRNRLWPGGIRRAPPAAVRITSPPAPGRAAAASAHSEAASGRSWRACWRNDRTPVGLAPLGASGAVPGSDDARPSAITSSVATPVGLPVNGTPEIPASCRPEIPARGRTSGNRDATDAPAAADSPERPSMPPTTGCTPAMPNKKEKRSDCSCVSGTTAPATGVSMS